jgi:antitoxin (DNA-binding transcriptional repressor) of toxin-antitoxin stability system
MNTVINAKELRSELPQVVRKVRRGVRFTVLYRSRPAFQVVPLDASEIPTGELTEDPLYRAKPLGRSVDGRSAAAHDFPLGLRDEDSSSRAIMWLNPSRNGPVRPLFYD